MIFLSALAAAGCATTSDAAKLAGTSWTVVEINGHPAQGSLRFGAGTFDGDFGCNRLSGTYHVDGNRLRTGPTNATQMACDSAVDSVSISPMMLEAMAFDLLAASPRISWHGTRGMTLIGPNGAIRLNRN